MLEQWWIYVGIPVVLVVLAAVVVKSRSAPSETQDGAANALVSEADIRERILTVVRPSLEDGIEGKPAYMTKAEARARVKGARLPGDMAESVWTLCGMAAVLGRRVKGGELDGERAAQLVEEGVVAIADGWKQLH